MSIGFVEAQTRFCGNCYRPMRRNFFLWFSISLFFVLFLFSQRLW
jgi:hypothetical protein